MKRAIKRRPLFDINSCLIVCGAIDYGEQIIGNKLLAIIEGSNRVRLWRTVLAVGEGFSAARAEISARFSTSKSSGDSAIRALIQSIVNDCLLSST